MSTRQKFNPNDESPQVPTIIAHRGASGDAPENTLASIIMARDLGTPFIEIDVRLTKDKVPVVLHDTQLKGVSPAQAIRHLTLAEARKHDVGSWSHPQYADERIPTLEEAIATCGKSSSLMVEIKRDAHGPKTIADSVFHTIHEGRDLWHNIVVGSFSHHVLQRMQHHLKHHQHTPIELIGIVDNENQINAFLDMGIQRIALWHKLITPELLHHLETKRISVWTFTVNTPVLAHKLARAGVHGLITNFPEKIQNHLANNSVFL